MAKRSWRRISTVQHALNHYPYGFTVLSFLINNPKTRVISKLSKLIILVYMLMIPAAGHSSLIKYWSTALLKMEQVSRKLNINCFHIFDSASIVSSLF